MATKWASVIDAAATSRARVIALCKEGLENIETDDEGNQRKEPSTKQLREGGFVQLAGAAEDNARSRGKPIAHSLRTIITRLSAAPAAKARLTAADVGAADASSVSALASRVAALEAARKEGPANA